MYTCMSICMYGWIHSLEKYSFAHFSFFLMTDQTIDIISHREYRSFIQARSDIKKSKGALSHPHAQMNTYTDIQTLPYSPFVPFSFSFFFVIKIANDYFSSADGHINETIAHTYTHTHIDHHHYCHEHTHTHTHTPIETIRCQNDLFLLRRTCGCNFLFIASYDISNVERTPDACH
jgi:hypothetical protein